MREPERAFFLYDEMKVLGNVPNEDLFAHLISACGTAPVWVSGYQDTIFDAMALMEGAELLPTRRIYNAVIKAFGKANDPVAAEFYFWEMSRKGILPDEHSYEALLDALGRAQIVYSPKYGTLGRYVRPERKLSEDDKAYIRVGPERVAKISKCTSLPCLLC